MNRILIMVVIMCALALVDPLDSFSQFSRMMTNFSALFEDKLTGESACGLDYCSLYLDVEYQSSYTIVLEGKLLRLAEGIIGYTSNDLIWKGVDMLKENGYVINSVQIVGSGTDNNPYKYHIIMSKPFNLTNATK